MRFLLMIAMLLAGGWIGPSLRPALPERSELRPQAIAAHDWQPVQCGRVESNDGVRLCVSTKPALAGFCLEVCRGHGRLAVSDARGWQPLAFCSSLQSQAVRWQV